MFKQQKNGRSVITFPTLGDRYYSRLINAVQHQFVTLIVRGTMTIAGAAAGAILSRGSLLACLTEIGIDENGTDRHIYVGQVLRMLSEMAAPSALSAKRVSSTAVGVYPLEEAVRIYFAHPFAAIPRETAYIEHDVKQLLQVFAKLFNDAQGGGSKIVTPGGGGTAVLSAVSIDVIDGYDATETARPFFIPTVVQQVDTISGANSQYQQFIKTSHAIRAFVVSQETTQGGEVDDIINKVVLRGDFTNLIGPNGISFSDLALESEFDFGGAVVSSNRAHLGINFQLHGRLANVLNPTQDNNLRFEFDCQPSVTGAGASQIRTTIVRLERDPALVDPKLTIPV